MWPVHDGMIEGDGWRSGVADVWAGVWAWDRLRGSDADAHLPSSLVLDQTRDKQ